VNVVDSLPSLKRLPHCVVMDSLVGYLYGRLCKVNPYLTMTMFMVRSIALTCLYQGANRILNGRGIQSHKIFVIISGSVNISLIIALKQLNANGFFSALFNLLFIGSLIGNLIDHISYIQDHERHLPQK
jgi:hypothetical protein